MTILHFIDDETKIPPKKARMSSLVCVIGKQSDYSDYEIKLLEEFARVHLIWDDFLGKDKRHADYVVFGKCADGTWLRQKEWWSQETFTSPTLEDALATMYKVYGLPVPPEVYAKTTDRHRVPPAVIRLRESPNA